MGFYDNDNNNEQELVERTERLNTNEEGEEGWSTGAKVAAGLGAAALGAAVVGGSAYAYKKHQEGDDQEGESSRFPFPNHLR